jgi:hypothetical protein
MHLSGFNITVTCYNISAKHVGHSLYVDVREIWALSRVGTLRHFTQAALHLTFWSGVMSLTGSFGAKELPCGLQVTKYVEREILNHRFLMHPHIVQFKEVGEQHKIVATEALAHLLSIT